MTKEKRQHLYSIMERKDAFSDKYMAKFAKIYPDDVLVHFTQETFYGRKSFNDIG